nr:putative ribonuclease H-like domain-containing protein [Tanacetum cinerariifolium]
EDQAILFDDRLLIVGILNGDSLVPTGIFEGVLQPVAPTTAEQKLARKNELKACGTLLMALPDKHQLKFNSHKDAKILIEAIKKRFGGNTETKNQLEIHGVSLSQEDVNLKFLRSLPSEWKTHTLIWRNKVDLEEQSLDDLFNSLKIYEAETGRNLGANGPTSMGFDMSKVECYNCHRKGHFSRECRRFLQKTGRNLGANETSSIGFEMSKVECYNYHRKESDCESWPPTSLYDRFQPSDGYHAVPSPYTGTFMPPKPDLVFNTAPTAVETDHHAFTIQLSPTKPEQDLSHINRPTTPIIEDWVSDYEDKSETKAPQIVPSFVQSPEQVKSPRHSVQHVETFIPAATHKPASPKSASSSKRRNRKACFVCKILTQSKPVSIIAVRPVGAVVPKIKVTRPRHANPIISKSKSPTRRHITRKMGMETKMPNSRPSFPYHKCINDPKKGNPQHALKDKEGNPQHALKDKEVIDSGCSRHMTGNMSYLSNFKELNGGYVAFGGNPKGGKISGKGKIKTGNLVRGLPIKVFENDHTCVACKKGKQLRASCKTKTVSSIDQPLYRLHMDLFVPTFVKSLNKKSYCLVVTDDYSRVLVTKPHNKTLYELLHGRTPSIGFMRPFGCPVTILNTLDSLGKFKRKVDEGFLVGYSVNSKSFRVFNSITRSVQETLNVNFLENKPNITGSGPTWLFDIDCLTRTMNYQPVTAGNQTNPSAGFQDKFVAEKPGEEIDQQNVLFPVWSSSFTNPHNNDEDDAFDGNEHDFDAKKPESEVSVSPSSSAQSRKQDDMTKKEAKGKSHVESFLRYRDLSAEFEDCSDNSINEVNPAGTIVPTVGQNSLNNTNTFSAASPSNAVASPTYGKSSFIDAFQLPDDPDMPELEDITYFDDEDDVGAEDDFNNLETSITISPIPTTRVHKDHLEEPKMVHQALNDPSWIEAMQEELIQFKLQKVWILVDLPHGKRAIGHTHEEGIDDEEVFAPVARIEAIRLFLAYASFIGFMVFQMDVKSAFIYRTIEEEVYVCQPPGFEDPDHPDKVYKVVKTLYGLHQAPRAWKFRLTEGKSASTPIDTEKPLLKDHDVCACARFQMTLKASHLHAVKRIFRYLKGKPHLGLWYPKDSPFDLVAYSDSDYAGASLDKKTTTRGCQFLGCRITAASVKFLLLVVLSGMKSLKKMSRVTNIISAGHLTTQ